MTQTGASGQILVLTDGSPAANSAARVATEIARRLGCSLAILGVSGGPGDDARIAEAVAAAQAHARSRVPSIETIQATGELLAVASRRVRESPTSLVVLGAGRRPGQTPARLASRVWTIVKTLSPPVLIVPEEEAGLASFLFCTGGARYIEEGARFAARMAASVGARVTVFHVSPHAPAMYGDRMEREGGSAETFLKSNSRLARNIRRQIEIFSEAGASTDFRVSVGDVADAVAREVRRGGHDLVIVGSSPTRGTIRTYVLGNVTHDIMTLTRPSFLVLRSSQPGFWAEIWRILTEPAEEKPESGTGKEP